MQVLGHLTRMIELADQLAEHGTLVSIDAGNDRYWEMFHNPSLVSLESMREAFSAVVSPSSIIAGAGGAVARAK